jgi:hypothetical protein
MSTLCSLTSSVCSLSSSLCCQASRIWGIACRSKHNEQRENRSGLTLFCTSRGTILEKQAIENEDQNETAGGRW